MAKTLFILNDPPYGTERSYNGLRLAGALAKRDGEEVRVFLLGDAAACAKRGQKTPNGYYNVERMLKVAGHGGGEIGVCGTCMDARGITSDELCEGTRRSTLEALADWTQWAAAPWCSEERVLAHLGNVLLVGLSSGTGQGGVKHGCAPLDSFATLGRRGGGCLSSTKAHNQREAHAKHVMLMAMATLYCIGYALPTPASSDFEQHRDGKAHSHVNQDEHLSCTSGAGQATLDIVPAGIYQDSEGTGKGAGRPEDAILSADLMMQWDGDKRADAVVEWIVADDAGNLVTRLPANPRSFERGSPDRRLPVEVNLRGLKDGYYHLTANIALAVGEGSPPESHEQILYFQKSNGRIDLLDREEWSASSNANVGKLVAAGPGLRLLENSDSEETVEEEQ